MSADVFGEHKKSNVLEPTGRRACAASEKETEKERESIAGCPFELFLYYDHLRALDVRDRPNYELLMRSIEDVLL